MNKIKLAIFSTALSFMTSAMAADITGTAPGGAAGENGPSPANNAASATPTPPTAVSPNGAMQTAPAPSSTSATPSAPNAAAGAVAPMTAPPANTGEHPAQTGEPAEVPTQQ